MTNERGELFEQKIQSFTLPLIASNLFQIIIAQVSLAIISRRSTEALAAIALIDGFLYAFAYFRCDWPGF